MVQAWTTGGKWLRVQEIANLLRVHRATVYKWCDRGELTHVRVNGTLFVSQSALAAFMLEHLKLPPPDER